MYGKHAQPNTAYLIKMTRKKGDSFKGIWEEKIQLLSIRQSMHSVRKAEFLYRIRNFKCSLYTAQSIIVLGKNL